MIYFSQSPLLFSKTNEDRTAFVKGLFMQCLAIGRLEMGNVALFRWQFCLYSVGTRRFEMIIEPPCP